jgi:uncharacterized protein
MLRGAQTPGELKTRTERLHRFDGMGELAATIERLIGRDLVERLDRQPGQREERYRHRLGEESEAVAEPEPAGDDRLDRLEREVAALRAEVEALRRELGS